MDEPMVIDIEQATPVAETHYVDDEIRQKIADQAKNFKSSWVNLGQLLYAAHEDKLFNAWGFDKFEDYTEQELGMPKATALKLLKSYIFLEQDEPNYLNADFADTNEVQKVPGLEEVNVLRLIRSKKELDKDDYQKFRSDIFKGKTAGEVRKDLAVLMKERKEVDPDEARDERNMKAIKKCLSSLENFKNEMITLKLVPDEIVQEADDLMRKLETQI